MDTQPVTRVVLTDDQLDAIDEVIAVSGVEAGVVAAWEAILGQPLDTYPGTIVPWDYALPEDQWRRIAQAMIDHDDQRGFPGGTWLNVGPSSVNVG